MTIDALLAFIRQPESRGDYNIVWSGIKRTDWPKRPLVTMTIGEVLAWQDSIDARYNSEAAGAYQIMEDTLRGDAKAGTAALYAAAGLKASDLFDEANQDKMAIALLNRRGLGKYLAGEISAEAFANRLAMEWASLPVVTAVKRTVAGRTWTVQPGSSYYAGDGLNKSHVSVPAFIAAVRAVNPDPDIIPASKRVGTSPTPVTPAAPARAKGGVLLTLLLWLLSLKPIRKLFGGK
jgi:muramidase (phage lysozyme)